MHTGARHNEGPAAARTLLLLRDLRGWSRAHLAAAAGVSERAVLYAERGRAADEGALARMAAALGVRDLSDPLEDTHARALVSLRRVSRASALAPLLSATAYVFERFDLAGPGHARPADAMERHLERALDAWTASGPVERLRFVDALQRALGALHRAGLALTAGAHAMPREPRPGAPEGRTQVAMFVIAPADEPRDCALWTREKTRTLFG